METLLVEATYLMLAFLSGGVILGAIYSIIFGNF